MDYAQRLNQVVEVAYERLCGKIAGNSITVDNEASLQLQFASVLKSLGELYEETPTERFNIELEKNVALSSGQFTKSGSDRAKIDIWVALGTDSGKDRHACAIELKFFKKANQREPNNRYDVFKDIHNLERYGDFVDTGFLLVATDHPHYVSQAEYSEATRDFNFRQDAEYTSGTELEYRTSVPYGPPIALQGSYKFNWRTVESGLSFMFLEVTPCG